MQEAGRRTMGPSLLCLTLVSLCIYICAAVFRTHALLCALFPSITNKASKRSIMLPAIVWRLSHRDPDPSRS